MPGSATVPNVLAGLPGPTAQLSLLDANYNAITSYINQREITQGPAASRPVPGVAGRWYFATDVAGGTLFEDNGSTWTAVAPGITTAGSIVSASYMQGSRTGTDYSTTSNTFVDVDATNLKASVTVPDGARFIVSVATYAVTVGASLTDGLPHVQFAVAGVDFPLYNWIDTGAVADPTGVFTIFGVAPSPDAGAQDVSLQFRGDGTHTFALYNGPNEGAGKVVAKFLVLVIA